MYLIIWEYQVKEEQRTDFEKIYGENGAWVELFQKDAGFLGTDLLRDMQNPNRFLTIDRWISAQAYEHFLECHQEEYASLDAKWNELTEKENLLGRWQTMNHKTR